MKISSNFELIAINNQQYLIPISTEGISQEKIYSVEGVGLNIISMIGEDKTIEEILEAIIKEYDIDYETLEEDTKEFLNSLIVQGIIEE